MNSFRLESYAISWVQAKRLRFQSDEKWIENNKHMYAPFSVIGHNFRLNYIVDIWHIMLVSALV